MSALIELDAVGQAELVRRGDVTPEELVRSAMSTIERLNPRINAVIHRMFDEGLAAARTASTAGAAAGPLHGVPFLLKDLLAEYAGSPYRAGSRFLDGNVSTQDAELTRRYKAAGLIILGKTNLPELAVGPATEPKLFGATRNPWNLHITTGGSSGGAAAAVAAGLVPLAHANDGGGSIRIPASCCGLVGLKPSRGRNPLGPRYGQVWGGLVSEHVVSRSVRDSAAALDATHGPDVGAPYWFENPPTTYLDATARLKRPLSIAFTEHTYGGNDIHEECRSAVRRAAALCESLGHKVVEARPPIDEDMLFDNFTRMLAVAVAAGLRDVARIKGREPREDEIEPLVWLMARRGEKISGGEYLTAAQDLQAMSRQVAQFHEEFDVMLTPTLGQPPVPIGSFVTQPDADPFETRRRMWSFAPFPQLQNATGQPAVSLPLHWTSDGLPVGVQAVARLGEEHVLFGLAGQLEAEAPWSHRWPPVSAAAGDDDARCDATA
ncbi:amidase [Pseudonocardia sulfidoxydans NBRC 16205]|uniref:Amidase n=2 Tax=Pseudonocardia sulfidoxydans TaxID=54011 RepID=A0A511DC39_9PSEU|nr:amidase [Pseudonocardia sulfidoxydans]GEL21234.1 amidase [Pseudonocardia sulfidoxydans NBRC 16205]